jgi:hypothetical protein
MSVSIDGAVALARPRLQAQPYPVAPEKLI